MALAAELSYTWKEDYEAFMGWSPRIQVLWHLAARATSRTSSPPTFKATSCVFPSSLVLWRSWRSSSPHRAARNGAPLLTSRRLRGAAARGGPNPACFKISNDFKDYED